MSFSFNSLSKPLDRDGDGGLGSKEFFASAGEAPLRRNRQKDFEWIQFHGSCLITVPYVMIIANIKSQNYKFA